MKKQRVTGHMTGQFRLFGRYWLGLAATAALMACGGGGGGGGGGIGSTVVAGDSTPVAVAVGPEVEIEGVVAKGLVNKARVSVYRIDKTTGQKMERFGPVIETDKNGNYRLKVGTKDASGFVVEADLEGADIEDETAPGTTFKGKKGEMLRSVVLADSKAKATCHVTPFTSMAADMAEKAGSGAGSFKPENVEGALKKVRQLTIDDPQTVSPTSDRMKRNLTTVARFVNTTHGGDLGKALKALTDASRFDVAKNGFVVDGTLTQQLVAACQGANCSTDSNLANTVLAEAAVAPTGAVSAVDAVKALFQDLLDTAAAYRNTADVGDVKSVGDRLRDSMEAAIPPVDGEMLEVVGSITRGLAWYEARKAGEPSSLTNTIHSSFGSAYQLNGGYVQGRLALVGTNGLAVSQQTLPKYQCELASTALAADGLDVANPYVTSTTATPAADINAVACYGIATQGRLVGTQLDDNLARHNSITVHTVVTGPTGGTFKYMHQTRSRGNNLQLTPTTSRVSGSQRFGTGSYIKDANGLVTQVTFSGELSPGFMSLKTRTAAEWNALSHVAINWTFNAEYDPALVAIPATKTNSLATLTLGGSMALFKKDGSMVSNVSVAQGSVLEARRYTTTRQYTRFQYNPGATNFCPAGATFFPVNGPGTFNPITFIFTPGPVQGYNCQIPVQETVAMSDPKGINITFAAASSGAKLEGVLAATEPSFDSQQKAYQPNRVAFTGRVYEGDGAGGHRVLLDGAVTLHRANFNQFNTNLPETALNYSRRTLTFDGKAFLANRPASGLALALTEGNFEQAAIAGTFFWGGKSFTISGNAASFNDAGNLSFNNSDGANFIFDTGTPNTAVALKKGNVQVGVGNFRNARLDFTDGSFQQF